MTFLRLSQLPPFVAGPDSFQHHFSSLREHTEGCHLKYQTSRTYSLPYQSTHLITAGWTCCVAEERISLERPKRGSSPRHWSYIVVTTQATVLSCHSTENRDMVWTMRRLSLQKEPLHANALRNESHRDPTIHTLTRLSFPRSIKT